MAFFLLMWLLGSTTEGDKKGIADYFSSPLKMALLASGSGAGDASHVVKGGGEDLTRSTGQVKRGDIEAKRKTINLQALKAEQVRAEIARLRAAEAARSSRRSPSNPKLAAHALADPPGHDARRPAHPDRRREPAPDVRQRQRGGASPTCASCCARSARC